MILSLINNFCLLLALSICHSFIVQKYQTSTPVYKILSGLLFGCVTIAGMMNPFVLTEGIIFDGRSIVASVAGAFGGPITAAIVVFIGGAYRYFGVGGGGALTGILVLASSAGVGTAFYALRQKKVVGFTYVNIYVLGVLVHIVMLALMFFLPSGFVWLTLQRLSLPVLGFYPIVTVVLAKLLYDQEQFQDVFRKITESEERYRALFENSRSIMLVIDPEEGIVLDANPSACQYYGYELHQFKNKPIDQINLLSLPEIQQEILKAKDCVKNFFEFQHRLADGQIRDVRVYSSPVQIENKTVVYSLIYDVTENKKIEQNLFESENRYRTLVENSPDGIFIQTESKIVYINASLIRMLGGHSHEDFVGQSVLNFFHPETHSLILERIHTLNEMQMPVPLAEEIMVDLQGGLHDVEASAVPICYKEKNGALVYVRNIEDRKRSQALLKLTEERFRLALTESPYPIILHNEKGVVLFINKVWTEISGYALEDIPTLDHWVRLAYGENRQDIRTKIADIFTIGHRIEEGEFIIQTRDGEKRIWEFSSAPLGCDPDGTRLVMSIAHDVTEAKEQKEILKTILDNSPIMTGYFSPIGGFRWVNKAWEETLGYSLEVMQTNDRIFSEFYPDDAYREDVQGFIQKADSQWGVFKTRTAAGVELDTMWMNIRLSDGSIIGIGIDITHERKLETQLAQSQKMESIGRLAGGVAHDFNNILTAIIGYNDFAMVQVSQDDPVYKDLKEIRSSAERAVKLTRQLLAFSRKQIFQPEILDLNHLIMNLDKLLRRLIGEDIEYVTLPSEGLWNAKVDPGQIEQVIINLVINARDAMPTGGRITVETKNVVLDEQYTEHHVDAVPGEYVMLAVSDTGEGIPADIVDKIFEPFYTTKEKEKGTGLGLSTVHGIVKQSQGSIYVYSEADKGTTFKVYLPRNRETSKATAVAHTKSQTFSGVETILVAEDDEMVRTIIEGILQRAGYTVLTAAYGSQAQELFTNHAAPVHLLITDVVMPKMSGKELAQSLVGQQPDLKVLFMSGYTDNAIVHHGMLDEGINFIQKPFTTQSLLEKIRDVLNQE